MEALLAASIDAARRGGVIQKAGADRHHAQGRPGCGHALHAGQPVDGHTLAETLEQVGILTGTDRPPKGYRGVEIEGVRILRSGQKRGITRTLKTMIKRRSAIEPAIGHMKMDGRLGRNPLRGALGDAIHAVMCGAGHNLRLPLAALRLYCAFFGLSMQAVIAVPIALPIKHQLAHN